MLKKVWATARDVFNGKRELADAMVHTFAWYEFGEESVSDLALVEYEELLSWLRWAQSRIDILGEVSFACWEDESSG